jgi:galactonate dehydratase
LHLPARRDYLKIAGFAGLAFRPSAAEVPMGAGNVKVTRLEVFHVKVNRRGNWTIARLQTNAGVTGIGDASQSSNDRETVQFLTQFSEVLKGRSVFDVEWFRARVASSIADHHATASVAASALEQCLWDIRGKVLSLPTYEMFGGALRTSIRNYANINRSTDPRTPQGFAHMASKAIAAGFNAVKLAPFDEMPPGTSDPELVKRYSDAGFACAQAVRDTIGPHNDLLIDVHSRFQLKDGLELTRHLEPLNLFWLEEVTPADPVEQLAAINRAANMPTAGGESLIGIKGFYPYVKAEAVDILMPDVKVCGGMWELKKIAALGEGAGQLVAPHGPASPVGNVAAAHVCATLPNFHILEFSYGEVPWRAELIEPAEAIVESGIELSRRPGLGITLNDKTAAKYAL